MKSLTSKTINFFICWNNLRIVPPKLFPTIQEIEKTSEILEILEKEIPNFVKLVMEGEEMRKESPISPEKQEDWNNRTKILGNKEGGKILTVEFENDQFNTFFQQFERWGKDWFSNIKEFLEFRRDMNATNSQSKEVVKSKK
ncbi:MAG: hypothetical protein NT155_03720 [Candidatus Staskawiczbacteria bacterium]|nr:hypothetical protein [Candidatus Staskawiczbacteria bacterium]